LSDNGSTKAVYLRVRPVDGTRNEHVSASEKMIAYNTCVLTNK